MKVIQSKQTANYAKDLIATIPEGVVKTYQKISTDQRGKPETLLVQAQHALQGSLLSYVIVHTGDLIHRLYHTLDLGMLHVEQVSIKTERVLKNLAQPYGFEKEFIENLHSNIKYYSEEKRNFDSKKYITSCINSLYAWGDSYVRMYPVYNEVQHLLIAPCIYLANGEYDKAVRLLVEVRKRVKNSNQFQKDAMQYMQNRGRDFKLLPAHSLSAPRLRKNRTLVNVLKNIH